MRIRPLTLRPVFNRSGLNSTDRLQPTFFLMYVVCVYLLIAIHYIILYHITLHGLVGGNPTMNTPQFRRGGDSFLFVYFIFTCIGIPIYVVYFVCDSASEFGAMGSVQESGFLRKPQSRGRLVQGWERRNKPMRLSSSVCLSGRG